MSKKRERLEVIRDILIAIREKREIKPTRLLYASNLSPQMFKEYVEELIQKGFICIKKEEIKRKKGEKKFIYITKKGNDFLEQYKVIEAFIEGFGL